MFWSLGSDVFVQMGFAGLRSRVFRLQAGFKQAEQYCPFGGCEGPKISQIGTSERRERCGRGSKLCSKNGTLVHGNMD